MINSEVLTAAGILCKLRNYLPTWVLKQVYYGIAYPHLQYAITNWGKAPTTYKNRVQVQHNRSMKLVSENQKHKTKLLPSYNKLSIMKIIQTYEPDVLKFEYKLFGVEFSTLNLKFYLGVELSTQLFLPRSR